MGKKFKLRREFGLAEIISLVAVAISYSAYRAATEPMDAFIVPASGPVIVAKHDFRDQCSQIIAIPISFHNSGEKAVTLDHLAPALKLGVVILAFNEVVVPLDQIEYSLFLVDGGSEVYIANTLKVLEKQRSFEPSHDHIGALVAPGDLLAYTVILVIDNSVTVNSSANATVFLTIDSKFGNGQVVPIRSAIPIDPNAPSSCS